MRPPPFLFKYIREPSGETSPALNLTVSGRPPLPMGVTVPLASIVTISWAEVASGEVRCQPHRIPLAASKPRLLISKSDVPPIGVKVNGSTDWSTW